jgi:hypothetical protein
MSSTNVKTSEQTHLNQEKPKPSIEYASNGMEKSLYERHLAVMAKFNMLQDKYGLRYMIYTN